MRLHVVIRGAVQGVGFRPFVYRLASTLGVSGWVSNSTGGVVLEAEGSSDVLTRFLVRLQKECPPRGSIHSLEPRWLDPVGFQGFEIRPSTTSGERPAIVLPDIAPCADCLREMLDPGDRRYLYPFTNCTNCGPRFSIIEALPYDRANTSMRGFEMCEACGAEYRDPTNRRFHAQPNACPRCGPRLEFLKGGRVAATAGRPQGHDALRAAARAVTGGAIVAVKGLGGFHLLCLASDAAAVQRLRERKRREEKPFAVMMSSVPGVKEVCDVSPLEDRLLQSPEAPIVLLKRILHRSPAVVGSVAPGNPWLGVMLPPTPLHHLLLREVGRPVVATSGNLSDEPICTGNEEARERLGGIADHFLVHNRPIVRHVDDSLVRVVAGRELMLRRARGYAPLPLAITTEVQPPGLDCREAADSKPEVVLAVGANLKNAVALGIGPQVFISQHIGDLETEAAFEAFRRVSADLPRLHGVSVGRIVADAHPDYLSTGFARQHGVPLVQVQHHLAHVLSCMVDNALDEPVLGVAWDGSGLGTDGTVWGGEFIAITSGRGGREWSRVGHLRPFRLPGGDAAVKEPRRCALGLLHELHGGSAQGTEGTPAAVAFSAAERNALSTMLARGLNSPWTSSVGRLFDAVAALTGLRQKVRHEGQAAMELEFAADGVDTADAYPLPVVTVRVPVAAGREAGPGEAPVARCVHRAKQRVDWGPLVEAVLADIRRGIAVGLISARFHNALAEAIVSVARAAGLGRVVLSGGCFQNHRLLERAIRRLREEGFQAYWHQRVPPNDGGIALGQAAAWRWNLSPAPSGSSLDSACD